MNNKELIINDKIISNQIMNIYNQVWKQFDNQVYNQVKIQIRNQLKENLVQKI